MNPETPSTSSGQAKTCQNCKQAFTIEPADFEFYAKIAVPPPTFCAECRNIQRFATRNAKSLYHRRCDKPARPDGAGGCGQNVISRISPVNPAKMWCKKCWWADDWDGTDYGRDYDFSRPFHDQFYEILMTVPHVSLFSTNMTNSDYCNMETDDKNCYLTFGGHYNEDCAYSEYSIHGKNVYDSYWAFNSEQCFGCINIEKCYRAFLSRDCSNCMDAYFSYDCRGCTNIIGCAGLRNKQYYIYNEQYAKEEYEARKGALGLNTHTGLEQVKQQAKEVWEKTPRKFANISQSVGCTGHDITNSKNSANCWNVDSDEDCKNMYIAANNKDCMDESSVGGDELSYMCANGGGFYNCKFLLYSFTKDVLRVKQTYNSEYSYCITNTSDCFGCVNLRKKQYCILNKRYSKEEYEELLPKIKQHMLDMPYVSPKTGYTYGYGDFFPTEHSLFAYNESVANDFYPMTKEEAEKSGFPWREEPETAQAGSGYVIPNDIQDVGDDILQAVLICEETGKAYRITKAELEFYRMTNLPIPRVAPLKRIKNRINQLLPFRLYDRECMKCKKSLNSPYPPDRPEIVYCEQCYQQEVV